LVLCNKLGIYHTIKSQNKIGSVSKKKLDKDLSKYLVPKNLTKMLSKLRDKTPLFRTEEEDDDLFNLFALEC